MKISEFIEKISAEPALKDASFAIADGCLCIIGEKPDGRYWHVPVMPAGSQVTAESVAARFVLSIDMAAKIANKHTFKKYEGYEKLEVESGAETAEA